MAENKIPDTEIREEEEKKLVEDTIDEGSAATIEDFRKDQIKTEKKNKDEHEDRNRDKNKTVGDKTNDKDRIERNKTDDKNKVEGDNIDNNDNKNKSNGKNKEKIKENIEDGSDLSEKPPSYPISLDGVEGILQLFEI